MILLNIGSLVILGLSSLVASAVLFRHKRLLTYLGTAAALLEAHFLGLVALAGALHALSPQFFLLGSLAILVAWAVVWRSHFPRLLPPRPSKADLLPVIAIAIMLFAVLPVNARNGLIKSDFVLHGFYNGDVVTFASLVQRALLTPGQQLTNPFAANGELEYPTLLHEAFAQFWKSLGIGLDWIHLWPIIVLLQLAVTVPLLFLIIDSALPEPAPGERWLGVRRRTWVQGALLGLVALVITLSMDSYIYPQSHFFITNIFLLLAALVWRGNGKLSSLEQLIGTAIALVLLLSNAVTGTAAVAIWVIALLLQIKAPYDKQKVAASLGYTLLLICAFFLFTPGESQFGQPGFSYTASGEVLRFAPLVSFLIAGILLQLSRYRTVSAATVVLLCMAAFTFVFSTRDIVVANASRFIYHALLLSFPLLLRPMLRAWHYVRLQLVLSQKTTLEKATGWATVAAAVGFILLPNLASVASAYDQLLFQHESRITLTRREILWQITDLLPPSAVIVANPEEPWDIPLFTGRALVRASDGDDAFWLSRDDETLDTLRAAFAGDTEAQKKAVTFGDYLLLSGEEQSRWSEKAYPVVFQTPVHSLYRLR